MDAAGPASSRRKGARCVIVTSNYHVFRTAMIARKTGIRGQVTGARTAGYFWPSAMLREFAAVFLLYRIANLGICFALAVVPVAYASELGGQVGQMVGDEMDDVALALDATLYRDHASREDDAALAFVQRRPDHQVGYAGLVLDCDEHDALGGSRFLTHKHQAGGRQPFAVTGAHGLDAGHDAAAC